MILIVGNWKMAPEKTIDAQRLAKTTLSLSKKYKKNLSIVTCPPFIHISSVSKISKSLKLGAQTVSPSVDIAQTGAISAGMLKSFGVSYCIVGHSESRTKGETNEIVAQQTLRLLEKKITPIICIGERERDHQGWYLSEVKDQLEAVLSVIPKTAIKNVVIAYEPVWAIGAGAQREATVLECREMIIYIRKIIADHFGVKVGDAISILYGGSVDEKNAKNFIIEGKAQGHLVGRVSLDTKRFTALVRSLVE